VQLPIGLEDEHRGVVDLVAMEALSFQGARGEDVVRGPVPADLADAAEAARAELVEAVAEVDDALAELFLEGAEVSPEELRQAIRRATISLQFVPAFMGSAFKNKGVQALLDGVVTYLPSPLEVPNEALDLAREEAPVALAAGRYGQLTYLRVYQGTVRKGDTVTNVRTGKRVKVPRLVRIHSDELEDIAEAGAGEIVALFGVDCSSGDTFTSGGARLAMTSMRVPDPVMSLAVTPAKKDGAAQFSKALQRFQKEDPTFRVSSDAETGQTIISGMGELHLDIYLERMRREYGVETESGKPRVNFREAVTARADFDYLHKKQSGGQGQFGRVTGYVEPLPEGSEDKFVFENAVIGNAVPPNFLPAIEKGFREAANAGALIGHPVEGVKVVLTDGAAHAVDSNEMAFKLAALYAFRAAYPDTLPVVLEPVMKVEITVPAEFQGAVISSINRRKGVILDSSQEVDDCTVQASIPLNNMFGYSTDLRSMTQGKGEFTMEYAEHAPVPRDLQEELASNFAAKKPLQA